MTYYHGFQSPQMVFCGFPLWFFQRAQVVELSDFVLQDIFGFTQRRFHSARASDARDPPDSGGHDHTDAGEGASSPMSRAPRGAAGHLAATSRSKRRR